MPITSSTKNQSFQILQRTVGTGPLPANNYDTGWYIASTTSLLVNKKDKNWSVTPGYESIIKATYGRKTLPMRSYSYSERQSVPDHRYRYIGYTQSGGRFRTDYYLEPASTAAAHLSFPSWTNSINAKLMNKVKEDDFLAPVAILEARKTAGMVTTRALHIAKMVLAVRSGNFSKFVSLFHKDHGMSRRGVRQFVNHYRKRYGTDPSGAAANAFLEAKYGWMPFMSDVRVATNTLLDLVESEGPRIGRVFVKEQYSQIQKIKDASNGSYLADDTTQTSLSVRAVWYFKPTDAYWPSRFGLTNPLEVAWELVPFSFVADWFLPIGDYLSTLDVSFRVNHLKGTYGTRYESTRVLEFTRYKTPTTPVHHVSGTVSDHKLDVVRTPMVAAPKVDLLSMLFDPKIGSSRAMSAVALLRQQVGRLSGVRR